MNRYQIAHQTFWTDDPGLPEVLAQAHSAKLRPCCLCRNPGVAMYIAKVHGSFMVKRMPNSGADHAPVCDSYDPPPELSGLGDLMGSAIQENPAEGWTTLKLNFSLAKAPGRAPPTSDGVEHDSVKTDGNKLTLRGLLHFLWEEAGFNRWSPAMEGKRSWYVVRKYLLQAAQNKTTKGLPLANIFLSKFFQQFLSAFPAVEEEHGCDGDEQRANATAIQRNRSNAITEVYRAEIKRLDGINICF